MSESRAIKRIQLIVVLLASALVAAGLSWRPAQAAQEVERPRAEMVGIGTPAAERAGGDDDPLFVVHFLGDYHGTLDPCG